MRIDHVSYAAEPDGLKATVERLAETLGTGYVDGGNHPRFGTRNAIIPLKDAKYLEVVEVLDHPACDKEPFGQAVRARSEEGGGWLGWVVSMPRDSFERHAARLEKTPYPGLRRRPDGVELRWEQFGVKGLMQDPQLPYFVTWESPAQDHPSQVFEGVVDLMGLVIAGDPTRLREWLGLLDHPRGEWEKPVDFSFISPKGHPGLDAVTFGGPKGPITI